MKIRLLAHAYEIYDLREDGTLEATTWPLFVSEEAVYQYLDKYGVSTGSYVILMVNP